MDADEDDSHDEDEEDSDEYETDEEEEEEDDFVAVTAQRKSTVRTDSQPSRESVKVYGCACFYCTRCCAFLSADIESLAALCRW